MIATPSPAPSGALSDNVNVIVDDARHYLEETDKKYDLILFDVYRGEAPPPHVFTLESLTKTKSLLNDNGLIIVNFNDLAKQFTIATSTIPLVVITGDPIAAGLLTNLAHPGGNLTGVSINAGLEIYGKRLQIIKEAKPKTAKVAALFSGAGFVCWPGPRQGLFSGGAPSPPPDTEPLARGPFFCWPTLARSGRFRGSCPRSSHRSKGSGRWWNTSR